jgi:O-antigen/teichoic acid export membrane protein
MKRVFEHFKGDGLKAQLIRGFTGNSGLKVLNMFLTLASGILLARILGPEGYGVYAFVLSIIALLGLPTQGGLPTLVVRETARYHYTSAWGKLRGLLMTANTFVIGVSFVTAAIAALMAWQLWGLNSEQTQAFLWALLLLPLVAFGNVRGATLRGLRKVVQGNLPEQVVRPLVMSSLLLLAALAGWQVTPELAVQYTLLGALAAFLVGAALLLRIFPREARSAQTQTETSEWLKSLVPLTIFSSLNIANNQMGIVFLGMLGTSEEVAFFRVAFQGATLVSFGLLVLNAVLAPHIVRLYEIGDKPKLQKMLTKSARMALLLSLPLAGVYVLWGDVFVALLFGEEYLPAVAVLLILTTGQLLNVAAGSVGLVLSMLGHEMETVKASVCAVIINAVLAVVLIPEMGASGAAVATAVSVAYWNIQLVLRTYSLTQLNTTPIRFRKIL